MVRSILLFLLVLICNASFAQSQRLALMEEFTQASCPPCEQTTPALNATLNANVSKVIQIRYQVSWPGVDPMNADNPDEVRERVDYYGVQGVPNAFLDGIEATNDIGSNVLVSQAEIDTRYATESPLAISVSHELASDLQTMNVTVDITNEGTDEYDISTNRLRVALIEELITWPSPPGSTSITVYDAVFKTFYTTAGGETIPAIAAGDSYQRIFENVPVSSLNIYDYNTLGIVAFIQNDAGKEMVNSAMSSATELMGYPDVSVSNTSSNQGEICDLNFTPTAEVMNLGDADVANYDVKVVVNGQIVDSQNVTELLPAGGSKDITFPDITLSGGTNSVEFTVETDVQDIRGLNNNTLPLVVGKASAPNGDIEEDFESDPAGEIPTNTIVDRPFGGINFATIDNVIAGADVGGHGTSEKSILINFWAWDTGSVAADGSMTIATQFDITSASTLSFDYAYTSWQGSDDQLTIQISTDCGLTYTDLWEESGASLRTAPEVNSQSAQYIPSAEDWETADIDLSSFINETALIRFAVTSDYGDNLWIDNINVRLISAVEELEALNNLSVYPNPVHDQISIDFDLNTSEELLVELTNTLGQRVLLLDHSTYQAGSHRINQDMSNVPNGMYYVTFRKDNQVSVQKISVNH